MTKAEQIKTSLLKLLTLVPMISTTQAATFFSDAGSPNKRASQLLKELEADGLIEGKRRLDKPKVWRLSRKGRESQGSAKRPFPLTDRKVDHHLAVGDVLLQLRNKGRLTSFQYEPREKYQAPTGSRKYCPDAYFIFNGRAYLLELQLSPMSSRQWEHKWQVAREAVKKIKWDREPTKIIVLTRQQRETVGGKGLPLLVVQEVADFVKWEAWLKV